MAKTTGKNLRTTRFSFRRMALYGVALALALLIASAVMGAVLAVRDMRDRAVLLQFSQQLGGLFIGTAQ